MEQTIHFERNSDGKYEGSFASARGVLQVDRKASAEDSKLEIYTNISGMRPVRRAVTTKEVFQVELDIDPGLTIVVISDTPVEACKFVSND